MKKEIEDSVKSAIEPVINDLGYEVVEVKYGKQDGDAAISIVIFKKGDMGLDDCEKVNNAIDPILEDLDPTKGASYRLNISSMGLDWPLVNDDDYRRRLDEEIEVSLYAAVDGSKKHVGILKAYDKETFTIENTKKIIIERKNVAKAAPFVKF